MPSRVTERNDGAARLEGAPKRGFAGNVVRPSDGMARPAPSRLVVVNEGPGRGRAAANSYPGSLERESRPA
jgi:hypothetical protein